MILVQQLVLGLLGGGLYGLAAAGLSRVFGVLKVLNVAHGELIMLGGYGAFWLWVLLGFDPLLALPLVVAGALAFGVLLYWGLFAFVVRAHEETRIDRKSTRLNSSHSQISYAVFCLKKKKRKDTH